MKINVEGVAIIDEGKIDLRPHAKSGPSIPSRLGEKYKNTCFSLSSTTIHSICPTGSHKEPSPNEYERQNADGLVLRRGPSFTHQFRREGTVLWGSSGQTFSC